MSKKESQHTYIFVDPNEPEAVMRVLRQILIGKLLEVPMDDGAAKQ